LRHHSMAEVDLERTTPKTTKIVRSTPFYDVSDRAINVLQRTTLECPSGHPAKLGHTLEASLFIHSRRLEVIARHPDPPKAPISSLSDESVQYLPRITTSSICLIDPHLFEFGSACPRISSGDPDRASRLVSNHKAQSSGVIAPDCTSVVVVDPFFNFHQF